MMIIDAGNKTLEALGLICSTSSWSPWNEAIIEGTEKGYTIQGLCRRLEKINRQHERHVNRGGMQARAKCAMILGGLVKSPYEGPMA